MQNIKNFKVVKPTPEQMDLYADPDGYIPIFLQSEDGQDWFECHKLFADDTVKIMYDSAGVIRSVVDAPVPERGDIYAVSMLFPENMSVVEVAQSDYPDGVQIDGSWIFDGNAVVPYRRTAEEVMAIHREELDRLMDAASRAMMPLEDAVDLGMATEAEVSRLKAWKGYRVALSRVDLMKPVWPELPG
jgi:hypothetical protein